MSKVIGPLFSLTASKTLGKTITYMRHLSGHVAYKRTIPYDTKSPGQMAMRAYMGDARSAWRDLPLEYRQSWNDFVF